MKLEPPTRAVVEPYEQEQVVESRNYPETLAPSLMGWKEALFAASVFSFRDIDGSDVTVPRARGLITMALSQASKVQFIEEPCKADFAHRAGEGSGLL